MSTESSLQTQKEILSFILRTRPLEWLHDFPTAVDLDELFQNPEMVHCSRLWYAGYDQLAAYSIVHFPFNNLTCEFDTIHWSDSLEENILAWADQLMRARYPADLAEQTLDGTCRVEDQRKVRFFTRHGFEKQEVETVHYVTRPGPLLPAPQLPAGFTLRPLDPQVELEEVVSLHQAAFGTENFTRDDRLAVIHAEGYIPELDLVMVAPDGSLAGNCICGIDQPAQADSMVTGYTDPVVVHPRWQRRGIARALLLHGLAVLQQRGVREVHLGTSSTNIGMCRAADAAGFECTAHFAWFSKVIQP